MFCEGIQLELTDLSVVHCRATRGAGIFAVSSDLTVLACRFEDNQGIAGTLSIGGGIFVDEARLRAVRSTFERNGDIWMSGGGAIGSQQSLRMHLVECSFLGNRASSFGGALYVNGSDNEFRSCLFLDNGQLDGGALEGGAMRLEAGTRANLEGCWFASNFAVSGSSSSSQRAQSA